jgi:hypothetical protein
MESEKFDITQIYPRLYTAKQGVVEVINVPMLRILAISGEGDPKGPSFQQSVDALYSAVYSIMSMPKSDVQIEGFVDFKVPPLEVLWSMRGGQPLDISKKDELLWEIFVVVPGFVSQKIVNMAILKAKEHKENDRYDSLHISSLQEKKSAQILHIGSYATEAKDIETLHKSIKRRGYKPAARHHEIYLSDPTRTKTGRLKTIIRQPIIKI